MKRLAFYTFWEKDGIVRKYVLTYLKGLQEVADKIIVIVNGKLSLEGKEKLEKLGITILQRANKGFDFGAWKAAFEFLGWEEVRKFDELVLTNCSNYGPVYHFSGIFKRMEDNPCDFWGLTQRQEVKNALIIAGDKDSYIRRHIQSFFIVIRQKVILSEKFFSYWDGLVEAENLKQEISEHETRFTEYLESVGFSWDTVFKPKGEFNPSFYQVTEYIDAGYPLVKRKLFNCPSFIWTNHTGGDTPRKVLKKIEELDYPIDEIFEDLLATCRLSVLNRDIHFNRIIPSDYSKSIDDVLRDKKIAAVFFAYYPDLANRYLPYILNLPKTAHICLISSRQETLDTYSKLFREFDLDFECRIKPNQGRDFSAYCIAARDIYDKYDYVCCLKDKKAPHTSYLAAESFDKQCWDSVLFSRDYVNNCLRLFYDHHSAGMIFSPPPNFGPYIALGNEMSKDRQHVLYLWKELKLQIPQEESDLIAPFGSIFWIKSAAIRTMLSHHWTYEEMPAEPIGPDGTLLHGLERIWAYAAQNDGYYPVIVTPTLLGEIYYGHALLQLRDLNAALFEKYGINVHGRLLDLIGTPSDPPKNTVLKEKAKHISIKRIVKYRVMAKVCHGKRRKHYEKKLSDYLARFA